MKTTKIPPDEIKVSSEIRLFVAETKLEELHRLVKFQEHYYTRIR